MNENKSQQILKYILSWLPAVVIMIIIFCFSAKVANDSAAASGGITKKVVFIIEHITNITIEAGSAKYELIHHLIRKIAHFLEYMALGCALVLPYANIFRVKKAKVFIISEITAAFYACTDEFHQLFVPGRSGNLKDVWLDSLGALAGVCVGLLIWKIIRLLHKTTKIEQKE